MPSAGRRAAAVLAMLVVTLSGCSLFGSDPKPDPAAQTFLTAWARGDVAAAGAATDDPTTAQAALQSVKEALNATKAQLTLGTVTKGGHDAATAAFQAAWTVPGVEQPWQYDGRLALVRHGKTWTVHWEPADVHTQLAAGQKINVERALPDRAALEDATGAALFTSAPVVTVGIEPRRATDVAALASTLATVLKVSAADIVTDVRKAAPTAFVPVITLRRPAYLAVKPKIYNLPGTVFRESTQLLPPTTAFAEPMLGRVGTATAEVLKEAGSGYVAGDVLGTSGLQRALNSQLTGSAGMRVRTVTSTGAQVAVLGTVAPKAGTAVRTTLDPAVQNAADAAVATQTTAAAIVAIRPSTGALLAVANNSVAPYDIALSGRFPAGSTFKTVTATALLSAGVVTESSTVACPGTTVVYGKMFQNENKFDLGSVPLRTAFAHSCNTTFTALTQKLDDAALGKAATAFGVGSEWTLPVESFGGSLPAPKDDAEKAADAIGQGRVQVSPLALALVAAAVQRGAAVTPMLVAGKPATPAAGAPAGPPAAVLPALRDMMRAVVTEGTAKALADVPGEAVSGKTGTAEYGTATPPRSHAWFIGFRGDLAFAVFVYDGQSSGTTAVPAAHTFLTALGG